MNGSNFCKLVVNFCRGNLFLMIENCFHHLFCSVAPFYGGLIYERNWDLNPITETQLVVILEILWFVLIATAIRYYFKVTQKAKKV